MAHPLNNPQIGDFAYFTHQPQKAGVIVELIPTNEMFGQVKIKMTTGEVLIVSEAILQNFNALIEEHQKKLATHLVTLEKLNKIKER